MKLNLQLTCEDLAAIGISLTIIIVVRELSPFFKHRAGLSSLKSNADVFVAAAENIQMQNMQMQQELVREMPPPPASVRETLERFRRVAQGGA